MPLLPLLPIFHRLNREHFDGSLARDGQPLSSVRWSDARMSRTAGLYRRGPGIGEGRGSEIVLSKPLLEPLPQEATESTLCHEMIHAWVDLVLRKRESHGPRFRARMEAIMPPTPVSGHAPLLSRPRAATALVGGLPQL